MKVWIDQDLCTGDGLCEEICPSVFTSQDDGLFYVKTREGKVLKDGEMAEFDDDLLDSVQEACDDCPGECIFVSREE